MSKPYHEPDGKSFPQLEEGILRSWDEQGLLQKVKAKMKGGEPLVFCEGPPTANNRPHIGHARTRVVKDSFLRYHVMNGREVVPYIGGWDCHGLPVELEIERSLGISSKKDIERLGVDKFNDLCRESVLRYKIDWERMSRRIGYWMDFENAYMTMSNAYIESVWWSLKQLHSKGLLSKGRKVVPYCPRCGTTLSNHEVALGFKETEDRFVVVKFRLKELDASLLVWTATPWALPANALVAVDKDQEYVLFEHSGERLMVSAERPEWIAPGDKPLRQLRGSELIGKHYEPPFRCHEFSGEAFTLVHSHEVPKDQGTGAMNLSPPYGAVDFEICARQGLEVFDPLDDSGRFTDVVPEIAGRQARDADSEIMRLLESKGLLFRWGLLKHAYPFCWRCDTGLIYKAMDSWFIRTSEARRRLVKMNDEVKWVPETFKHGRFGKFLTDARDWAVSRTRYWGTPLPIWHCPDGHEICIGSVEELREHSMGELPEAIDLHRPQVDRIALHCPQCEKDMVREEYVLDCWYDSGCAPFAQYHYPFENIGEFDTHRSVDFIAEGVDQTRGWFYTQHVLGTLLFDEPAFKSVLVLGQVLDADGKKITRGSAGATSPDEIFDSVGADATRLFFLSSVAWQPVQFSEENVRETMVGTLNTLLNVYAFFSSNANAYGFEPQQEYDRTHDLDRWIISRLHSTAKESREGFDLLEIHRSVKAMESFVNDLSNWYVRRSRRRFWEENDPLDRFSAHCTLNDCLVTIAKLMAPVTPFFSDWLYGNLTGGRDSVHLEEYPTADETLINETLERQMTVVMTAVEVGRLARQKVNVKLRQPLSGAVIATDSNKAWTLRRFEKMIAEELNVKRIEVLESREKMVQYAVSPNLRILGPKLKTAMSEVVELLTKVDGDELVKSLRANRKIRLGGFDLTEEDIIVSEKDRAGFSHADIDGIHVYVALEVTSKLRLEGLAREVIRRIQHMRKQQKLAFEQTVVVEFSGHAALERAISSHMTHIMRETHATQIVKGAQLEGATRWVINKMPLELLVKGS